ncbi:MAG TPA: hypothetical protein VJ872_09685 [Nocardioides sp.]|nr:hypothetical protein [Nocardioides sp.]
MTRSLPALRARVIRARSDEAALAGARPRGVSAAGLGEARRATLDALVEYAAAIEALSWPVPRSILMEIRMHKILCDPRDSYR